MYAFCQKNPGFESSRYYEAPRELITQFKVNIQNLYPQVNVKIDIQAAFRGVFVIRKVLRHMLYSFHDINTTTMESWAEKTEIKKPMDVIKFIRQNTGMRIEFQESTPIYVWNSDKETHTKVAFGELQLPLDVPKKTLYEKLKAL